MGLSCGYGRKGKGKSIKYSSRLAKGQWTYKWQLLYSSKWCHSHQVDDRAPSIKPITKFLLYLFKSRKLQPSAIHGYRSAIVANWVIHPLMSVQTVFPLTLGSGNRRSETHTWVSRNIRHQSEWSKVSLYHSNSFLSKNRLAKEGPDSVVPVVIPTLAPNLEKSLKADRSLCPGRALVFQERLRTKISPLPLSPHESKTRWSSDMSSLTLLLLPAYRFLRTAVSSLPLEVI